MVSNAFSVYCGIVSSNCGSGALFLYELAFRVGNFFAILVGGLSVAAICWGGVKLATSGGNEQGMEDAKKIMTAALIGLVLAIAAEGLVLWFGQTFWSFGIGVPSVPL